MNTAMKMPAGRYYIGDLCYVMTDDEWDEVCELTIRDNLALEGVFEMKGNRKFALFSTMWGDGAYEDTLETEYGVDSGTIGCIRVDDLSDEKREQVELSGSIVEFETDFEVCARVKGKKWDGVIQFGHILIDTDPNYCEVIARNKRGY